MALTNNLTLVGYCAEDPVSISKQEGQKLVKIAVYTKHWWNEKDGSLHEQIERHQCLFFGKNAERAIRFLQKGSQVHLQGTIHYETRTKSDQTKAYYTQVMVQEFMVSDRIAISKEMYSQLFPNDQPKRVELGNTKAEIENFDTDRVAFENRRVLGIKGVQRHE